MATVPGDEFKKHPPLVLSPNEIAYLVKGTAQGLADYPRLRSAIAPEHQATAVAIILAESGGNVYALNATPPDLSYGLAQINMLGPLGPARRLEFGLKKNEELYQADLNVAVMAHISISGNNFRPWSTYTNGAYKKHLATAQAAVGSPANPGGKLKTPQEAQAEAGTTRLDEMVDWVNRGVLRGASFVGGVLLIGFAVVTMAKKGVK